MKESVCEGVSECVSALTEDEKEDTYERTWNVCCLFFFCPSVCERESASTREDAVDEDGVC